MALIENLIKFLSKIYRKLINNAPRMVSERSQMGSRWPLESSLGSVMLSTPLSTAKPRPFWSQNGSKIELEASKNQKSYVSEVNFQFDVFFRLIFDEFLINFHIKMD